jgi:hypothetical protein
MPADPAAELERVRGSLYEWALRDVLVAAARADRLAMSGAEPDPHAGDRYGDGGQRDARLAFVGAFAWLDAVVTLANGGDEDGWVAWVDEYLKPWKGRGADLYALRCALVHNYGTRQERRRRARRRFALGHGPKDKHGAPGPNGRTTLNIRDFAAELDAAWDAFYRDCLGKPALRRHVVRSGKHLLRAYPDDPAEAAG